MNTRDLSLCQAVADGRIRPGDIFLHRNGERGLLNAGIRYVQARALRDLNPRFCPARVAECEAYTHGSMCVTVNSRPEPQPAPTPVGAIAEQYAPHARIRAFADIDKGTVILVKRLLCAARRPRELEQAIDNMLTLARNQDPYPLSELLYYWFRWGSKLGFNRKFAAAFRSQQHDVCSVAVVRACRPTWFANGEWAEAYYPARLAIDTEWTETVGVFTA